MAGTILGGIKSRDKILAEDPNFYKKIGAIGGRKSRNGGFASTERGADGLTGYERAAMAGAVGGAISKRGPAKPKAVTNG